MLSLKTYLASFVLTLAFTPTAFSFSHHHVNADVQDLARRASLTTSSSGLTLEKRVVSNVANRLHLAQSRVARKIKRDALLEKRGTASVALYTTYQGTKCASNSACVAAGTRAGNLPMNGVASCDLPSRHCIITCKTGKTLRENGTCTTTVVKTSSVAAVAKTIVAAVVPTATALPSIIAPSPVVAASVLASSLSLAPAAAAVVSSAAKAFGSGGITTAYAKFLASKCATKKMCVNAQTQLNLPTNGIPACNARYCIITCAAGFLLQSDGSCTASDVNCPALANGIYNEIDSVCTPTCNVALGYSLSGSSTSDYACTALGADVKNCGSLANACPPSYNGIGFAICKSGCNLQCPGGYYQYTLANGKYYCA